MTHSPPNPSPIYFHLLTLMPLAYKSFANLDYYAFALAWLELWLFRLQRRYITV